MDELFSRGVEEVIELSELKKALGSKRKLRLKLGVDPSAPDLHLGHTVTLRKLRQLQDMGHTVIFLIGDFTAKIGDPSGRTLTRPVLSDREIAANAKTYLNQVGQLLNIKKAEIRRNSEWLGKLKLDDLLKLASNFTVAQLIEREDFKQRLQEHRELGLHELLYPVMQAFDSVKLKADVEFGGSDQRFNILAGRALMKKMALKPQQVFLTKLLLGTDGKQKMSKSLGNYIGITEAPAQIFGKIMRVPDELMAEYFELCTDVPMAAVNATVKSIAAGANPRDVKFSLAKDIVALYHGEKAAEQAAEAFERTFSQKLGPAPELIRDYAVKGRVALMELLAGQEGSKSAARRLIQQGGVKVNGQPAGSDLTLKTGDMVQIGKRRFLRLVEK